MSHDLPSVGVFWGEPTNERGLYELIHAAAPLAEAERYGDCLTFGPGHSDVWDAWRRSPSHPAAVDLCEYDELPRGRVVYHEPTSTFWIYANRRLHGAAFMSEVVLSFSLAGLEVELRYDEHYG